MREQQADIAERLKAYMGEKDLTIEAVAKKINRNPRTVWTIIHGKFKPNDRTLYRIKKLLGDFQ